MHGFTWMKRVNEGVEVGANKIRLNSCSVQRILLIWHMKNKAVFFENRLDNYTFSVEWIAKVTRPVILNVFRSRAFTMQLCIAFFWFTNRIANGR